MTRATRAVSPSPPGPSRYNGIANEMLIRRPADDLSVLFFFKLQTRAEPRRVGREYYKVERSKKHRRTPLDLFRRRCVELPLRAAA